MANSQEGVQKQCNLCGGQGKCAEDGFDGELITCPACEGKGTVVVNPAAVYCRYCDGKGKIMMKSPWGKIMDICTNCKGTGWD